MRALSGKFLFGRFLEIGFAVSVLTAPTAFADSATSSKTEAAAPMRLAQATPPTQDQPITPGQVPMPPAVEQVTPPATEPATPPAPPAAIPKPFHGSMSFEAGSGKMLNLTLPAANIYVADPKVAEVRPASSTSLFVFGVGAGHTTIAAVDLLGRLLADYDITVRPSGYGAREAQEAIARLIPGSRIQVRPQGKGLILTGGVASAADAAQAVTIAKGYSGDAAPVANQMSIAAPTQVTLMVRVAEMKRSIARNLGVDWNAAVKLGTAIGAPAGVPSALSPLISGLFNSPSCTSGRACFDTVLNALAKDGLAHILAEPNLTVMSGQPATFQAGGEYPYPVLSAGTAGAAGTVTVAFKPFGVLVSFVPTVLSDGRINLHVKPEVSELDTTNTVAIGTGTSAALSAPALKVRRAETTVELGSGETIAIAGMLETTNQDNGSGIPGLGDTPIIGSLFRTNTMLREQTELVIAITPLLVRPVRSPTQIQIPADGYRPPGDVDRLLLLRQTPNADGSVTPRRSVSQATPAGKAGFIIQ